MIVVLTQPNCPNCTILKGFLKDRGVAYEEKLFTTEEQTEMVMQNYFGSLPIAIIDGKPYSMGDAMINLEEGEIDSTA